MAEKGLTEPGRRGAARTAQEALSGAPNSEDGSPGATAEGARESVPC
jgi:hypothetical protein